MLEDGEIRQCPSIHAQKHPYHLVVYPLGTGPAQTIPTGQSGRKYVVVTIDYFTKWVEAEPLTAITSQAVQDFFCKNIICHFGVPHEIIMDNGTQFDAMSFREFCDSIGTKVHFTSVS